MEDKSPMVGPGKEQKGYGAPSPSADNDTARSHNSNVRDGWLQWALSFKYHKKSQDILANKSLGVS